MLNIQSGRFKDEIATMRVTEDGRDIWMFEVDESWSGCGAGRNHVWVGDRNGTINIYDVASRHQSAKLQIPRGKAWQSISVSRDGLRLHVFEPVEQAETSTLHVIDLAAGQIIAHHPGIPGILHGYPTERADGWLLLTAVQRSAPPGSRSARSIPFGAPGPSRC